MFVTPGFADRSATLWWTDLEDAIAAADSLAIAAPTLVETSMVVEGRAKPGMRVH